MITTISKSLRKYLGRKKVAPSDNDILIQIWENENSLNLTDEQKKRFLKSSSKAGSVLRLAKKINKELINDSK